MNKEKEKKDYTIQRKACPVCHGMGMQEKPNGETFDCRNRPCKGGYIETRIPIKKEN